MDETAESRPTETSTARGGRGDRGADGGGVDRAALGYALLFSVPVWIGITVMMLKVTGGRPLSLVIAPGLVIGVCVFALVVVATRGGYDVR
jgi:hypothetical protein